MNPSDRRGFVYHKIILKKFESCKTLFPREPVQFLFPHTPHRADKDLGLGLAELPAASARRSEAGGRGLPPGAAGQCCRTRVAPCQVSKCLAVVVGWPLSESKTSALRWHSNAPPPASTLHLCREAFAVRLITSDLHEDTQPDYAAAEEGK